MSETGGPDLRVNLAGIPCANPIWAAAGCFNYGREFSHLYPLRSLGAICTKGTAPEPWPGNPGIRFTETPSGTLSAIGLMNPGIGHFLTVDGPWLRQQGATVVVNIVGRSLAEYVAVAERLTPDVAAGIEVNISCPNVRHGGMHFGTDPEMTRAVVQAVRRATRLPLVVKLSPNVTDVGLFARVVEAAGADAVSLINNPMGLAIDIYRRRPALGNITGGLAGPAVKPIALRMVWQVAGAVSIPVVGIGGITTWQDVVEFLMAGASAVQLGSACLVNPLAPVEAIQGLTQFMTEQGFRSVLEMVGLARPER